MAERAEQLGQKLPISISIGVDPAIEIGSCFEPPTTPLGYDELAVAGALRGKPVELCKCLTVNERAIANAEYVIEGEVIPGVRVQEDQNSHTGYAMPEFPGYTGPASSNCWLIKVKAVTHRENPIMQTCIGPSEEHVSMAGIPTEASIYGMVEKAMPGNHKYEIAMDAECDLAVYVLSRISGEGADRDVSAGDINLSETEIRDILYCSRHYKKICTCAQCRGNGQFGTCYGGKEYPASWTARNTDGRCIGRYSDRSK